MPQVKTSNRPRFGPPFITPEEEQLIVALYFYRRNLRVKDIALIMNIDLSTIYLILRRKGQKPNRRIGSGNFTNHPTKFERELHNAAVNQLSKTGGDC